MYSFGFGVVSAGPCFCGPFWSPFALTPRGVWPTRPAFPLQPPLLQPRPAPLVYVWYVYGMSCTHTSCAFARTHARTHARMYARMHACTHAGIVVVVGLIAHIAVIGALSCIHTARSASLSWRPPARLAVLLSEIFGMAANLQIGPRPRDGRYQLGCLAFRCFNCCASFVI